MSQILQKAFDNFACLVDIDTLNIQYCTVHCMAVTCSAGATEYEHNEAASSEHYVHLNSHMFNVNNKSIFTLYIFHLQYSKAD